MRAAAIRALTGFMHWLAAPSIFWNWDPTFPFADSFERAWLASQTRPGAKAGRSATSKLERISPVQPLPAPRLLIFPAATTDSDDCRGGQRGADLETPADQSAMPRSDSEPSSPWEGSACAAGPVP
jgi:hypothetical protein